MRLVNNTNYHEDYIKLAITAAKYLTVGFCDVECIVIENETMTLFGINRVVSMFELKELEMYLKLLH